MSASVDLNRGVRSARHPEGYWVHMYLDAPGVYFNDHLTRVSNEEAQRAGFDIKGNERRRRIDERRRELEAQAERQIDEEMSALAEELDIEPGLESEGPVTKNVAEAGEVPDVVLEILRETKNGRPRETNLAAMVWKGAREGWNVVHKRTGRVEGSGMHAAAAEHLLMNITR